MSAESRECPTCGNDMAMRIVDVERGGARYDQFTEGIVGFDAEVTYSYTCIECKKCACMVKGCKKRARHLRPSTVVVKGLPGFFLCDEHQQRIHMMCFLIFVPCVVVACVIGIFAVVGTMTWPKRWVLIALSLGALILGGLFRLFAVGRKKRKYMLVLFGNVVESDKYL